MINTFDYDSVTGVISWRENRGNVKAGSEAGTIHPSGYRVIRFQRKAYPAHHLAWFLYYGKWPNHTIDHINHERLDNSINNLRDVPQSENQKNKKKSSRNTSGANGVTWHKTRKKFQASITVNGRQIFLGYRDTLEEAVGLRVAADLSYRFSETHGL